MDGVGFFVVDGLFFHCAGSGEDRGLLFAMRARWLIDWLGDGHGSVVLWFVLFLVLWFAGFLVDFFFDFFHREVRLSRPPERGQAGGFGTAEFLIPVGRRRGRLDVFRGLLLNRPNVFVLFVERLGYRLGGGEDGFILGEGSG
jgi:uncharacterized protein (DUF58 family)